MRKTIILRSVLLILFIANFHPFIFCQTNWTVKNQKNSALAFNAVNTLYQDQNGDVWVGTRNGLNIIKGEQWDTYTKSNGLPHKSVTDICEDSKGNMWLATFKGLARFNGGKWSYIQKGEGLIHNKVFTVETDKKGNIWVGTKKGVSVFDGKDWKNYTRDDGLISNWVTDIMEDNNGNIWFATKTGVSVFDGKDWKSFNKKDGLAMNFVGSLAEDSNGKIWFGALNGAFSSYNGSDWEKIKKGSGYYNTSYLLLAVIDGVVFTMVLGPAAGVGTFVVFAALGALPSQPAHVYIDSEDKIWFAAQPKGVFMLNGQNQMHYSTKNGLPHNRVNDIMEMKDGSMWFATLKGIAILK